MSNNNEIIQIKEMAELLGLSIVGIHARRKRNIGIFPKRIGKNKHGYIYKRADFIAYKNSSQKDERTPIPKLSLAFLINRHDLLDSHHAS